MFNFIKIHRQFDFYVRNNFIYFNEDQVKNAQVSMQEQLENKQWSIPEDGESLEKVYRIEKLIRSKQLEENSSVSKIIDDIVLRSIDKTLNSNFFELEEFKQEQDPWGAFERYLEYLGKAVDDLLDPKGLSSVDAKFLDSDWKLNSSVNRLRIHQLIPKETKKAYISLGENNSWNDASLPKQTPLPIIRKWWTFVFEWNENLWRVKVKSGDLIYKINEKPISIPVPAPKMRVKPKVIKPVEEIKNHDKSDLWQKNVSNAPRSRGVVELFDKKSDLMAIGFNKKLRTFEVRGEKNWDVEYRIDDFITTNEWIFKVVHISFWGKLGHSAFLEKDWKYFQIKFADENWIQDYKWEINQIPWMLSKEIKEAWYYIKYGSLYHRNNYLSISSSPETLRLLWWWYARVDDKILYKWKTLYSNEKADNFKYLWHWYAKYGDVLYEWESLWSFDIKNPKYLTQWYMKLGIYVFHKGEKIDWALAITDNYYKVVEVKKGKYAWRKVLTDIFNAEFYIKWKKVKMQASNLF